MVTYYNVTCACGHVGKIRLRENDTPYSSDFWESYSLVDLDGYQGDTDGDWDKFFATGEILCPQCQSRLTARNMK